MNLLSRTMILRALNALAGELEAMERAQREEIVLAGGAALVLLYNAREATRDVDVCSLGSGSSAVLREAARRVAGALDLPEDWLNDGAKGYLQGFLEPFLVPGRELKARYAFEDLWESVHGS